MGKPALSEAEGSTGTLYWYSLGGELLAETDASGNIMNEYVYFAGRRVARRDSGGNVYYSFGGLRASDRVITNSTGTVCYDSDFYPFGDSRVHTNNCPQNTKYAGMEQDSETGFYHTQFRQYYTVWGRWLSPDPLGGDVTNPQSLNRYAYVTNNPTNFIDPLGLKTPMWCSPNADCFTVSGGSPPDIGLQISDLPGGEGAGLNDLVGMSSLPAPLTPHVNPHGGTGGGTPGSNDNKAVAAQAATQYCEQRGEIAFDIPFTDVPVTLRLSATGGPVNYSTTNDITPVGPALPIPPFVSAGVSLDVTVAAPDEPSPTLSVGAGKNLSVGSYMTKKGWQGLTISLGPSVGPPVNFTLPPGNACGKLAEKNSGG